MSSKFSQFDLANPAAPLELVGLQDGKNVRTGLVDPVCADANGLVEIVSLDAPEILSVDITTSNVTTDTMNGSVPITAANIDAYIAAYIAAHP